MRFVHQVNDGEEAFVLFEDPASPLSRAVWAGALTIDPPQSSTGDGWLIRLAPVDRDDDFPRLGFRREIIFGLSGNNRLTWMNLKPPVVLAKDETAPELPSYESHRKNVLAWTTPGQSWEGTVQYKEGTSSTLRMTIMEFRDDGKYVRLMAESPDDPFVVSIFEGTVSTDPGGLYGWPLQLRLGNESPKAKGSKKETPFFDLHRATARLNIMFDSDGSMSGTSRAAGSHANQFSLKIGEDTGLFSSSAERWRNALKAGTRWSGTIIRGDQPADKLSLTVAEVREQGRIYNLLIQNPDNPHQFRYYTGTFDNSDGSIDSYALMIQAKSIVGQKTNFGYTSYDDIFGIKFKARHGFRLTPDGKTLLCNSAVGELISLTQDDTSTNLSLDQESMTKLWKATCVSGNRWRGTLSNPKADQSVQVELVFATGIDDLGNVAIEVSSVQQAKIP